ncbi:hypothetical protein E2C01_002352 [Portunus trituberculatus]|uniref:Uncharacterized protein n=1 Tax=Portunus trituberculatus TaxID=210409 RepID=A0A5B7CQH5_PORTR|nr:hypothetical protein [Portunus trituberculatus]
MYRKPRCSGCWRRPVLHRLGFHNQTASSSLLTLASSLRRCSTGGIQSTSSSRVCLKLESLQVHKSQASPYSWSLITAAAATSSHCCSRCLRPAHA